MDATFTPSPITTFMGKLTTGYLGCDGQSMVSENLERAHLSAVKNGHYGFKSPLRTSPWPSICHLVEYMDSIPDLERVEVTIKSMGCYDLGGLEALLKTPGYLSWLVPCYDLDEKCSFRFAGWDGRPHLQKIF